MSELTTEQQAWRDGYEAGARAARELILNRVRNLPVLTVRYPGEIPRTWYLTDEVVRAIWGEQ